MTTQDNRKRILIVDDDIEMALTMQALMQVHEYEATTAENGAQALKMLMHGAFHAIVCDLNMPELSGDLFYLEVGRVRPQLLKRFIFLTGQANHPLYAEFLKKVKVPVLSKPVSFDQLLATLHGILGEPASAAI